MPAPEHRGGESHKEPEGGPEYWRAARYPDEEPAREAYFQAQDAVFDSGLELSAYRFQLDEVWHVSVLGETPPPEFDELVQEILATDEPAEIPEHILIFLNQRRLRARKIGPWVEGHYRPGKPMGE